MTQEFVYSTEKVVKEALQSGPKFYPYDLVNGNALVLRKPVNAFDFADLKNDPSEIASRLIETANKYKFYSVTANQCGLPHRVFVAGSEEEFVAFFNPEIIVESIETILMKEYDLSNPGLVLNIKRPKSVTVQYQDYNSEIKVLQVDGLTARIVQQNIDRLNGIDFKTKVSEFVLARSIKSAEKRIKVYVKRNMIAKRA